MNDLITALSILLKYGNPAYPTCCEHDILYINEINPDDVSSEDIEKLSNLGFKITNEFGYNSFYSHKFGS